MTIFEAIEMRHTVRNYNGNAIAGETLTELERLIEKYNAEGNIRMQLVNGREGAFDDFTIHYGVWTGVTNYIAMVGPDRDDLDETLGYYGEQIVLWAEQNGLKTGWLDTQQNRETDAFSVGEGERHVLSLAIGYSDAKEVGPKPAEIEAMSEIVGSDCCDCCDSVGGNGEVDGAGKAAPAPQWFYDGMKCAVYAPTAGNQRLFRIKWDGENVSISSAPGFLEKVDLGIAKYHFEVGSGKGHDIWK